MQRYLSAAIAGLFASTATATPSDADRATVPEWDELVTGLGYDYDMYKVTTEDSWELSLFRITGKAQAASTVDSTKSPLLLQHSSMMDAEVWLKSQPEDFLPMPMQLVDLGYDVWMSNSRGTKYSMKNTLYPYADDAAYVTQYLTQNKAKYDFTWFDQGVIDLPAFMDKIYEVTNRKMTYVGYGEGTSQLFYGLTQREETYFADKLDKAILLAPCLFVTSLGVENYQETFPVYEEQHINVVNDDNWQYDVESVCRDPKPKTSVNENEIACAHAQSFPGTGEQMTTKSLELYD